MSSPNQPQDPNFSQNPYSGNDSNPVPPPNANQPLPQQTKKKGGCMKWGLIIVAVLFIVGACSTLLSPKDESSNNSTITSEIPAPVSGNEAPAAPAPAAPAPAPAQEAPKATNDQKNALRKAESYSKTMHMSKQGIYDQLTSQYGEKYSAEAAQYAVDNLKTDYNKNALEKAKSYQKTMSMSPAAIYDQLVSSYGEKFTAEEAQYAVDNLPQ